MHSRSSVDIAICNTFGKEARDEPAMLGSFRKSEETADRLNRLMVQPNTGWPNSKEMMTVADRVPSVNISETDEEFHVEAKLSEVKKEEVKVMLGDGILTV